MPEDSPIFLHISPASGTPIYRQLIDQIERMVVSGQLKPGDSIPSVRQLALRFDVNPMTISKAYSLLEATGTLERQRGKGMRVAETVAAEQTLKARLNLLEPALQNAATQARQLNIPDNAVMELMKKLLENGE